MAGKNVIPFLKQCLQTTVEHGGLDRAFRGVRVVSASPGRATFRMTVEESHANM